LCLILFFFFLEFILLFMILLFQINSYNLLFFNIFIWFLLTCWFFLILLFSSNIFFFFLSFFVYYFIDYFRLWLFLYFIIIILLLIFFYFIFFFYFFFIICLNFFLIFLNVELCLILKFIISFVFHLINIVQFLRYPVHFLFSSLQICLKSIVIKRSIRSFNIGLINMKVFLKFFQFCLNQLGIFRIKFRWKYNLYTIWTISNWSRLYSKYISL
jgi:hypothetical protein